MQDCLDVLEQCWLKTKDFLRDPCPTLRKHWAIVLLAIYALASLGYQASAPWRERTFSMGSAEYRVISPQDTSEEYRLAVHYPKKIPIETVGERGRPLVAWLWQVPPPVTAAAPLPTSITPTTAVSVSTIMSPSTVISTSTPNTISVGAHISTNIIPATALPTPDHISATAELSTTAEVTATVPVTWQLLITANSATSVVSETNIVFTDKDGLEIASVLKLQAEVREPEAPRTTLYISRFTDGQQTSYAGLDFQLWRGNYRFTLIPTSSVPVTVELESRSAAFRRKLCDLILNTPALTWVSVVTIGVNFWVKEREKKTAELKELRSQIQALKNMPVKQAWETYWNLYEVDDQRQDLKKAWKEIETLHSFETSKVIRKWLTVRISQYRTSSSVDTISWDGITDAQSSLSKEEVQTLRGFFITEKS